MPKSPPPDRRSLTRTIVGLAFLPSDQPPTYYRLLGIDQFESDPEGDRDAAERQMAHVRRYQLGRYSELSQKLLNELGSAKGCLLDPIDKARYDGRLTEAEQHEKEQREKEQREAEQHEKGQHEKEQREAEQHEKEQREKKRREEEQREKERREEGLRQWEQMVARWSARSRSVGHALIGIVRMIDAALVRIIGKENTILLSFVRVFAIVLVCGGGLSAVAMLIAGGHVSQGRQEVAVTTAKATQSKLEPECGGKPLSYWEAQAKSDLTESREGRRHGLGQHGATSNPGPHRIAREQG